MTTESEVQMPDLGQFIDYVYALKAERDELRAALSAKSEPGPVKDERKAFIEYIKHDETVKGWMLAWNGEAFEYPPMQNVWNVWQARATLGKPVCYCETETARETRRKDGEEAVELQRILFAGYQACRPHDAGLMGWAAAVLSAPPAGVPEGWRLMPEEATSKMIRALWATPGTHEDSYAALLAAAPTPPASEQQQAVVMPEPMHVVYGEGDEGRRKEGWNDYRNELLRLNPHLAKSEGDDE